MQYKLKNYSSYSPIVVVRSENYASIIEHSHDFVEIIYVQSGKAVNVVGSNAYKISKGDVVIVPLCYSHYIRPETDDFRIINIIFYESAVTFDTSSFDCRPINIFNDKMLDIIRDIVEEYTKKQQDYVEVLKGYLNVFLRLFARKWYNLQSKNELICRTDFTEEYIDKIVQYITENYKHVILVEDIAGFVGFSKGYLQRMFKKCTGLTLVDCIIRIRIQESCRLLLETNYSIYEIAGMVGFSDLKHFYNKFKKLLNMTPKQYRKQNADIAIID